jgi:hypothetical protein
VSRERLKLYLEHKGRAARIGVMKALAGSFEAG